MAFVVELESCAYKDGKRGRFSRKRTDSPSSSGMVAASVRSGQTVDASAHQWHQDLHHNKDTRSVIRCVLISFKSFDWSSVFCFLFSFVCRWFSEQVLFYWHLHMCALLIMVTFHFTYSDIGSGCGLVGKALYWVWFLIALLSELLWLCHSMLLLPGGAGVTEAQSNRDYVIQKMSNEIHEIIRVLQLTTYDEEEWDADDITVMKKAQVQSEISWFTACWIAIICCLSAFVLN